MLHYQLGKIPEWVQTGEPNGKIVHKGGRNEGVQKSPTGNNWRFSLQILKEFLWCSNSGNAWCGC